MFFSNEHGWRAHGPTGLLRCDYFLKRSLHSLDGVGLDDERLEARFV